MRVGIFGARGHASEVCSLIRGTRPNCEFLLLDEIDPGGYRYGAAVLGNLADFSEAVGSAEVFLGVGEPELRKRFALDAQRLNLRRTGLRGMNMAIGDRVEIAPDADVMNGVQLTADVTIGASALINNGVMIHHGSSVGAYCSISPGAILAGNVVLEEGAFVGIGAALLPGVRVGRWASVGAGAVVTSDVAAETVVVGVPAAPI